MKIWRSARWWSTLVVLCVSACDEAPDPPHLPMLPGVSGLPDASLHGGGADGGGDPAPEMAPPPPIVLILADDMGWGDLGANNPDSGVPTPHLDALAQQGVRFVDAHAPAAVCQPTRYGLLTGRYPFRPGPWSYIEAGRPTIAGVLRDAGYETAMIGKWHLGFYNEPNIDWSQTLRGGPLAHGFDSFFGIPASLDIPPYLYVRDDQPVAPPDGWIDAGPSADRGAFWRAGRIAEGFSHDEVLPTLRDEAIQELEGWADSAVPEERSPLFLYVALTAPHAPWLPDEEHVGASTAGEYGDFVAAVDTVVGDLLEALERAGVADEALVVFTSDNGPNWKDEDRELYGHDALGGWRGKKGDAWEGGHRMPFVARWPGRIPEGTTSTALLCLTDLMATFATIGGGEGLPDDAGEDSLDMTSVLLDPSAPSPRTELVTLSSRGVRALRSGPWKLIENLGSGGFTAPALIDPEPGQPEGQLYDLVADPAEQHNLWDEEPERVEELRARLQEIDEAGRTRG